MVGHCLIQYGVEFRGMTAYDHVRKFMCRDEFGEAVGEGAEVFVIGYQTVCAAAVAPLAFHQPYIYRGEREAEA